MVFKAFLALKGFYIWQNLNLIEEFLSWGLPCYGLCRITWHWLAFVTLVFTWSHVIYSLWIIFFCFPWHLHNFGFQLDLIPSLFINNLAFLLAFEIPQFLIKITIPLLFVRRLNFQIYIVNCFAWMEGKSFRKDLFLHQLTHNRTKPYFFDNIWVLYFVLFFFYAIQKVITFKVFWLRALLTQS